MKLLQNLRKLFDTLKKKDKIVINSSTRNLHLVREFIEKKGEALKVEPNILNQILVSVDEACTNIIKHNYKYDDSKFIEVEADTVDKKFIITLLYRGDDFDPTKKLNPDMKEYFAKYKVGGLGIPLMKKSMDSIEFSHTQPDINSLTLIKVI
jgi:serine/threonine-protein kinase RsbW